MLDQTGFVTGDDGGEGGGAVSDEVKKTLRRAEFRRLVKETHDAIDEYAEGRLGGDDWFGSPGITLRATVKKLTDFNIEGDNSEQ